MSANAASAANSRVYLRTSTRVYHHWMLTEAAEEPIECHIYTISHEEPGHEDILGFCGIEIYQQWLEFPICKSEKDEFGKCTGLTLHNIGAIEERLKTTIWLPLAEVDVEMVVCQPWEPCESVPELLITGYEPLQNHQIESMHIEYGDRTGLVCWRTDECQLSLPETGLNGTDVIIYVRSSYGDQSNEINFRLRNMVLADGLTLYQTLHTEFDFLAPPESIAWGVFPDIDLIDAPWLALVNSTEELTTSHDYALLAGRYIIRGDIDISECVYGGLLVGGAANQCGMELAQDLVYSRQNEYDQFILAASQKSRIPPRIIKGVIGQESQFWTDWYINGEYGLGMITDEGIEMMLTWNPVAFLELCIPEFGADDCAWGYHSLGDYPQDYMRGLAMSAIGTDNEVNLIAQTITGAAAQAGQIVRNVTRREPYEVLSYQDMWKISLGVYNGGAGCLYNAIDDAWDEDGRLSWGGISENLIGDCQYSADYPNVVLFKGVP
ncbi:MAG: hypothetical protein ABFS17_02745 [Chloroflexota bacterium]